MDALPTAAVDGLAAEAALVSIGLENVFEGDPKFSATERHVAAQIPKAIRSFLLKFMTGADQPEGSDTPKYNHKKVGQLLADGPQAEHALALQKAVGDQALALSIAANATRILHQLQRLYPRPTTTSNVAGAQPLPATPMAARAFARTWAVAMDPLIVFRDLLDGCLSPDMARALEELYPNLYELTLTLIPEVYASIKAKRPQFQLSGKKDRALGVLQGMAATTSNLPLAAAFASISQAQQAQTPQPRPTAAMHTSYQTPGQKS